jgi:hypothetical protein
VKKSRSVPLSLVSTLAAVAIASGCGSFGRRQGWQTCVDRSTDTAVDRQYCDDEGRAPYAYYPRRYHWYYYPRGYYWNAPGVGTPVPSGGTYMTSPHASAPMARSGWSAVRGGFGSTAAGHAGSGA